MKPFETPSVVPAPAPPGRGPRRRAVNPSLLAGGVLVGAIVVVALLSYAWTPHDAFRIDSARRLLDPTGTYWLGTDKFGRDIASRLMIGARTTLFVGVVAVGTAALVGTPLGVVAGMARGWRSGLLLRASDLALAFPALLLAIMFGAVFGASTLTAMVAIGLASVPAFVRIVRAGTLRVMATEYVLAARAAGRRRFGIGLRHVLPNVMGLVIVQASVSFAIAVLAEAGLSFLGFGTAPPTPSWGRMLQESQELLFIHPLLAVWPGLAIVAAVLGFNLLGDGLRDRFDPRMEER
ncbi:ABC transporter permease [Actinopolymorpha sp. B11F2]|uniref:ABC transporter permease n=1 Tax=Actinopolymorpha sp. B11F2 TaxID=3160862 RepID=UPI0032E3DBB6